MTEPAPRRARVLEVDDEPMLCVSIKRALSADFEVMATSASSQARDWIAAGERFDAIVCDVMMPEMSGVDFHSELSSQQPQLASQIIFLTGGAFTLCARQFLDRISNPRLDKPFDSERLRGLVNRQVARARV